MDIKITRPILLNSVNGICLRTTSYLEQKKEEEKNWSRSFRADLFRKIVHHILGHDLRHTVILSEEGVQYDTRESTRATTEARQRSTYGRCSSCCCCYGGCCRWGRRYRLLQQLAGCLGDGCLAGSASSAPPCSSGTATGISDSIPLTQFLRWKLQGL